MWWRLRVVVAGANCRCSLVAALQATYALLDEQRTFGCPCSVRGQGTLLHTEKHACGLRLVYGVRLVVRVRRKLMILVIPDTS